LDLIDWNNPDDPIRQLIIPREGELSDWGVLDASNEQAVTVARGVQHKYTDTVLLLCNEVCGAYCRYCFRKRLFMDDNDEVTNDVSAGLEYISAHEEVTNVLLTGGDPLPMSTHRLAELFEGRPTAGNEAYELPIVEGWHIFQRPSNTAPVWLAAQSSACRMRQVRSRSWQSTTDTSICGTTRPRQKEHRSVPYLPARRPGVLVGPARDCQGHDRLSFALAIIGCDEFFFSQ
jgi:hypothetical protein